MKKFLTKLSYTVLPVFLILFGLTAYVTIYVSPRATGDLGHLALIPFDCKDDDTGEMKELLFKTLNHSDSLRSIHADVLTVGDSFSKMGRLGYQNYLAAQGVSVVNCSRELYENPFQYAYHILDEKLVDSTNFSVLVVQVGERDLVSRSWEFDVDKVDMYELHPESPSQGNSRNPNTWSLLRARDFLMYRLCWSPVYKVTLDKDYFNNQEPRSLYFYSADITNGLSIDETSEQKVQDVYQILTRKAEECGIAIRLMFPVDKYDIYQDHIVDNPYPRKTIIEDVRRIFGDTPHILLCKDLLTPLIEKGEKDVFLFDDSHWSRKGSAAVGKELSHRVKKMMNKQREQL